MGLTEYFTFYNGERPHQLLSNLTPDQVYKSGQGGGAKIVDKFCNKESRSEAITYTGQRSAAVCEVECII